MKIRKLFNNNEIESAYNIDSDFDISGIKYNSKNVNPGDLFFCINGVTFDGHNFAKEAINKGARAIVTEKKLNIDCPQIVVNNSRSMMAICSKRYYNNSCDKLKVIGVTGTNGKTTTTNMITHILRNAGKKVGIIGTPGVFCNGQYIDKKLTTPDPTDLHHYFRLMELQGIEYVVMEVSAHALALNKLDGIKFELGIITNITQDHLDFFGNFENYKNSKLSFFNNKQIKKAILNFDDNIIRNYKKDVRVPYVSYANNYPSDNFTIKQMCTINGNQFIINVKDNVRYINSKIIGKFNIENTLAAASACVELGIDPEQVFDSIETFSGVKGRFNLINVPNKGAVIIDYAHTPDGLEKVLQTARGLTNRRVICVFGCGGNRDKLKRPIMGEIAEKNSDLVVITNDNPRFEDPSEILKDIQSGFSRNNFLSFEDRVKAINIALNLSQKGDVVCICGKGAEPYMEIKGKKIPYSDYKTVENYSPENVKKYVNKKDYIYKEN